MYKLTSLALVLSSAFLGSAQDFSGKGNIFILKSTSTSVDAKPSAKVACVAADGKMINPSSNSACGVFTHMANYPYITTSTAGNCTWTDKTQEQNTDNPYGGGDFTWHCFPGSPGDSGEGLYTISGKANVILCYGDVDCFFEAKKFPAAGQSVGFWPYRWGSQQTGLTPGHVQLQLLWNKL